MTEVHLLTRCAERRDSEEHKCHAEEEVADIAVALAVDEQQGDEERGEHEVRHVEREAVYVSCGTLLLRDYTHRSLIQ